MDPAVRDAITHAADEAGIDPAFALAVADRESQGNPTAHNSKTIYGLFQMSGPLRQKYGAGDSSDPLTQARGWTAFAQDLKAGLAARLGREPSDAEIYAAHHFGEGRAARMIGGQIGADTNVADVFTPYERSINPHFDRAGTVGNLMAGITGDITQREGRFGGAGKSGIDFAAFGEPQDTDAPQPTSTNSVDFAQYGAAADASNEAAKSDARPGTEVDLSQFGLPAPATPAPAPANPAPL